MKRWIVFIKERFPLGAHLPMIVFFTLANGGLGSQAGGSREHLAQLSVAVLVMVTSYFFRLRLFDEIKDYEVDLKINPNLGRIGQIGFIINSASRCRMCNFIGAIILVKCPCHLTVIWLDNTGCCEGLFCRCVEALLRAAAGL